MLSKLDLSSLINKRFDLSNISNEGAEKALLSSMLISEDSLELAISILKSEDFYNKNHGYIFEAMVLIYEKRMKIVPDLLRQELFVLLSKKDKNDKKLPELGEVIHSMYEENHFLTEYWCKTIKELSLRRNGVAIFEKSIFELFDLGKDINNTFDNMHRGIYELREVNYKNKSFDLISTEIPIAIERMKKIQEKQINDSLILSGIKNIDDIIFGFSNGEFIIIGARPGVGKTALALNMAVNVTSRKKEFVGFFSMEVNTQDLIYRILASKTNIENFRVKNGLITKSEFSLLKEKAKECAENIKICIESAPNINLPSLKAGIKTMKKLYDIKIAFIDYIGLVKSDNRHLPRYEQVALLSSELKALAMELQIPIIALSQLTREFEGKDPNLASLRESGALEQDADVVMLLSKDEKTEDSEKDNGFVKVKVKIAKNRNGRVGSTTVGFIPGYIKFEGTL